MSKLSQETKGRKMNITDTENRDQKYKLNNQIFIRKVLEQLQQKQLKKTCELGEKKPFGYKF